MNRAGIGGILAGAAAGHPHLSAEQSVTGSPELPAQSPSVQRTKTYATYLWPNADRPDAVLM